MGKILLILFMLCVINVIGRLTVEAYGFSEFWGGYITGVVNMFASLILFIMVSSDWLVSSVC